jgi:hypothetical protein
MIALLRLIPLSAWACIGLAAALGLQTVRVGWLKADVAELRLAIAEGAVEAERVTREAVEKARNEELAQREAIEAANRLAADKFADVEKRLRGQLNAAQRSLAEVPADACLDSDIPADVRRLLTADNQDGAG